MPLLINNGYGNRVWPSDVKESKENILSEDIKIKSSKLPGGRPRKIYFHIQNLKGEELNVPGDTENIVFQCWVSTRPAEIISEYLNEDDDVGFVSINGLSTAYINLSCFPTPAQAGDTLIFKPVFYNPGNEMITHILDSSSSPMYLGFDPLIPGSGEPIQLDMDNSFPVSSSVNSQGTVITLTWDEQPGAAGYNLYWSDDPYENYTLATTTTQTYWLFSIVTGKKFYRITVLY